MQHKTSHSGNRFKILFKKFLFIKTKVFLHLPICIGFLIFFSCAKLPIYESNKYVESEKENLLNPLTSNYDKKTTIQIEVANNDTNLYIRATFHDQHSYKTIMRNGLTVFFDPTGKKNKRYQLKIQRGNTQVTEYELLSRQKENESNRQQQNIITGIDITYNKVTWDKNGKPYVFYRNLEKKPIRVDLESNPQNKLFLEIEIPSKLIPFKEGQSKFSLGIESGAIESGNMNRQRPSARMSGAGEPGARRGSGGGGGRGRSGGGMNNGGSRPAGNSGAMQPIKSWILVDLKN